MAELNKGFPSVTSMDIKCLGYLAQGKSAKAIAKTVNLSPRTIEHRFEQLRIKLNIKSRNKLIEFSRDRQLDKAIDYINSPLK